MPPFRSISRLNFLFKTATLLAVSVALCLQIQRKKDLPTLWHAFIEQMGHAQAEFLLLPFLLLPVNWLSEAVKWRYCTRTYQPISLGTAVETVLSGVTFSLFTPQRLGDFGARLLFSAPAHRWHTLFASLVSSAAQILVIAIGGLAGLSVIGMRLFDLTQRQYDIANLMLLPLAGLGVYLYFHYRLILPLLRRVLSWRFFNGYAPQLTFLENLERKDMRNILLLCLVRYSVYTLQYFSLVLFFGITEDYGSALAGVAVIFLFQTALPLPALSGLLVRGNLAVFVWSSLGANAISALASSLLLWIINLIVPALLGVLFLLRVNIESLLRKGKPQ